jgi:Tfp pilus assembly protein PilW
MTSPRQGREPGPRDAGVSLVELLVGIGLFATLGTLLLGLALSTGKVTTDTRALANVSEESRLAMERMTRELRQSNGLTAVELPAASSTALTFWTDFNGNEAPDLNAADPEVITYRWDPTTRMLTLTANDATGTAVTRPVLAAQVSRFEVDLRSSKWQYDTDGLPGPAGRSLTRPLLPSATETAAPTARSSRISTSCRSR